MSDESDSPHSHWNQCLKRIKGYAADLKKAKARNIEQGLRSFVDQPAYWPEWRNRLVIDGMHSIGEKTDAEVADKWFENRA